MDLFLADQTRRFFMLTRTRRAKTSLQVWTFGIKRSKRETFIAMTFNATISPILDMTGRTAAEFCNSDRNETPATECSRGKSGLLTKVTSSLCNAWSAFEPLLRCILQSRHNHRERSDREASS